MATPLSILRPSAMRILERLPSAARKPVATRRFLPTFSPRPHRLSPTFNIPLYQRRHYSASNEEPPSDPSKDRLEHITEETSKIDEIMGGEGVNVDEVATPISEVIQRENDVENAPEVIKEDLEKPSASLAESVSIDTLAEFPNPTPKVLIPPYRPPVPVTPIPALHSIHHRQHPLLRQLTPHFMKHGELATAQATVQRILQILRTKPAPRVGKYPLVPNAPDLDLLPSDPVAYLQTAIDSVAPLFKMKSSKGAGGSTVQTPAPLSVKVRRRRAMEWMIAASEGKRRMKSLPERFAEEVEAVVLGTSSCWDKRMAVHKLAVTNRANIQSTGGKRPGARKKLSR
ncbi:hypothetical protein TWF694_001376 [Orbilia ellipsospora]|uniref:Small ribosomal subunit protein uS7 domain-containing protein n=1 Tax=Orbilia ellipsospora TaxID=2528407 RepID=A0AAV9XRE0_9PEZI